MTDELMDIIETSFNSAGTQMIKIILAFGVVAVLFSWLGAKIKKK